MSVNKKYYTPIVIKGAQPTLLWRSVNCMYNLLGIELVEDGHIEIKRKFPHFCQHFYWKIKLCESMLRIIKLPKRGKDGNKYQYHVYTNKITYMYIINHYNVVAKCSCYCSAMLNVCKLIENQSSEVMHCDIFLEWFKFKEELKYLIKCGY